MSSNIQRQHAGVWLDKEQAMIIANGVDGEYSVIHTVKSTGGNSHGSEHAMNNSKQTEELKFFKALAQILVTYDDILVFGPGTAQEQFQHHLTADSQFSKKKVTIDSAGSLTNPQMIAKVRDFFHKH